MLLFAHQFGDLFDQAARAALLDHEGQLGDDDRLLALLERLDVGARLDAHTTAAGLVGVFDAGAAEDDPAGREVRALDVAHQALDLHVRIVDVGDRRVDHLAQVVRRDVRRHANGDAGGAVDEQVGEACGEDKRFAARAVVVGREVDRVHVEIAQHLRGDAGEAGLGVAHRGRRIVVDRAEVALAVDQLVAHREVLRHPHERVVDRGVAVRVIVAHHLADDLGALGVGASRPEAQLVHRVEHAAMDRLQAVAHIWQRAPDDHRHRVVEVRGAHLLLERAGFDVAAADHISTRQASPLGSSPPYTSRLATALALSSMKARRGSTWSPMSIETMRSAA